jgi:hypothetical protein
VPISEFGEFDADTSKVSVEISSGIVESGFGAIVTVNFAAS